MPSFRDFLHRPSHTANDQHRHNFVAPGNRSNHPSPFAISQSPLSPPARTGSAWHCSKLIAVATLTLGGKPR
jgi:hypothetical protein